jgi:hypothetical protein
MRKNRAGFNPRVFRLRGSSVFIPLTISAPGDGVFNTMPSLVPPEVADLLDMFMLLKSRARQRKPIHWDRKALQRVETIGRGEPA